MVTQRTYTNRQLAEIAQVPLRVFERVSYVLQFGIPELVTALEDDLIKTAPAERIARLPDDRQLAELNAYLKAGPQKREPRTVMTDLKSVCTRLDQFIPRWSEHDRKVAGCILGSIARQLTGEESEVPA